jgi:hypothetical protein
MTKRIIGLTEKIKIIGPEGKKKIILARIDTGATISSMDTKIAAQLNLGPVVKTKRIKSTHGSSSRAVIFAKVKVARKVMKAEFTLADRKHMKFPILIGQNILRRGFLIDPTKGVN